MPDVILTLRVMPKSVKTDLDKLEQEIKDSIEPNGIKREPIAFGLVALNITKVVPDVGGRLEKVKNKLGKIEEISEVEVTEVTRSL